MAAATNRSPLTATGRLLAIVPILEYRMRTQRGKDLPRTLSQVTEGIAARHGVCERTIRRWYTRFLHHGFAGLARGRRDDAGQSRFAKKHPEILDMIRAQLGEGRSDFAIFNSLRIALGAAAPAYETVQKLRRVAARAAGIQEAA